MRSPLPPTPSQPHWAPGVGGLVLPLSGLPLMDPPEPDQTPIRNPHLTLLRRRTLAPLLGLLSPDLLFALFADLGPLPSLAFDPTLRRILRLPPTDLHGAAPEHPPIRTHLPTGANLPADPTIPAKTTPRISYIVGLRDQAAWSHHLAALSRAISAATDQPFPGEPQRFFHITCFNNRGGHGHLSPADPGPTEGLSSEP